MMNVRGGNHCFVTGTNESPACATRIKSASNEASPADCRPMFLAAAQNSPALSITGVVIGAYPSMPFNASRRPSPLLAGSNQLAAHFVIRNLRNHGLDSAVSKTREPV